jgi:putative ATPase subunit gpP of terminase
MPRRKYPAELWERCKALYVSGVSIRQIATQCGIPQGTVAARCDRQRWNDQRTGLIETKSQMIPPEQRADEIARVVSESRLATLQLEARAALELAKKTLAAVQGNSIDLETLEDIIMAQEYRLNIWPTPKPAAELEVKQHLVLHYGHEPRPDDGTPYFELKLADKLPEPRPRVLKSDGEQGPPPAA